MSKYAQNTEVSADRSRSEIEKTLTRYGATSFMYGWQDTTALIAFEFNGRRVKFTLAMPDPNDREFTLTPKGKARAETQQIKAYEQATRQRWRALALVIKAKLEAVEAGISLFEEEFMAHIVLPSGETVGDWMSPQIDKAYLTGKMPPLLLGAGESR